MAREKTIGTFLELGSCQAVECLGRTGLDYIVIDTEHNCYSEESAGAYIRAAENTGLLPYVRIGDIRRPYVLRMLDLGARGLIVPNITSVEQVRELVTYAKFPPVGQRGYCPNRTTGWGQDDWAQDVQAYMAACNRRCKLIPQCETREALEAVEEIASLEVRDEVLGVSAAGRYLGVLYLDRLVIYNQELQEYAVLNGISFARTVLMRQDGTALLVGSQKAELFLP